MADPTIMLVAGEPSGDILGARLIDGIRAIAGDRVAFIGVGGPHMAARGLQSLFPYSELTVMGLTEVLPRIPAIFRRIAETADFAMVNRPSVVVTIDAPDFSFRVAKRLQGAGIPLVHYVAPTVWAWRPGRARRLAGLYDHLLALLPFEPPYFEAVGLPCTFVGHPAVESGADKGDGAAFRARHGIASDEPLLCVLPGSRRGEVGRLARPFAEALALLKGKLPPFRAVVPTVGTVSDIVRRAADAWPVPVLVVEGDADKYGAFAASRAALAASGTVAVELALAGVPHAVAYRVNALTAIIVRLLVRVRFANIVNLIEDRAVVPELIQDDCTPDRLAETVERLMVNEDARAAQIAAFRKVASALGAGGADTPSRRAARVVLDVAKRERRGRTS